MPDRTPRRTPNRAVKPLAFACLLVISFVGCFKNESISGGTEIPNEVTGVLYTPAGTPAANAKVELYPVDYGPFHALGKRADLAKKIAHTNSFGQFAFKSVPAGIYNLFASGEGLYLFQDSIVLSGEAHDLPADTLRPPGTLAGIVTVLGGENPENAIVEILGTDWYAYPDSSGWFLLDSLPAGTYLLQVRILLPGYVPLVQAITVNSGTHDTLPEVLQPTHPDHSGRWRLAVAEAPFRGYRYLQLLVHDEKLWLTIEGGAGGNYSTSLWSSADGANWQKVHDSISYYSRLTVFQGKLWDIRHIDGGNTVRVANSVDGVAWTVMTTSTPLPGFTYFAQYRLNTAAAVLDGKLWLIGAFSVGSSQPVTIVHSSPDGITWTSHSPVVLSDSTFAGINAFKGALEPKPQGEPFAPAVFDGKLWLVGGYNATFSSFVNPFAWSSPDGKTWSHGPGVLATRSGHAVAPHDGKLWILGGGVEHVPPSQNLTAEVLNSPDGNSWTKVDAKAPFGEHVALAAVSFKGRLWTVVSTGGVIGPQYFNAVWYYE